VTEANQQEVFTARTESLLLPTSEAHPQGKNITAVPSAQVNHTSIGVLQGHDSSTGQAGLSNLKSQNLNPEMQGCPD
jgi:hypothetical protein